MLQAILATETAQSQVIGSCFTSNVDSMHTFPRSPTKNLRLSLQLIASQKGYYLANKTKRMASAKCKSNAALSRRRADDLRAWEGWGKKDIKGGKRISTDAILRGFLRQL